MATTRSTLLSGPASPPRVTDSVRTLPSAPVTRSSSRSVSDNPPTIRTSRESTSAWSRPGQRASRCSPTISLGARPHNRANSGLSPTI